MSGDLDARDRTRTVRRTGTEVWHWQAGCPDYPAAGELDVREGVPADQELCQWCATRGSGDRALDDRAATLLSRLQRDARLTDRGLRAVRVLWTFGDARIVFTGPAARGPRQVSRAAISQVAPVALADSLAKQLVRELAADSG